MPAAGRASGVTVRARPLVETRRDPLHCPDLRITPLASRLPPPSRTEAIRQHSTTDCETDCGSKQEGIGTIDGGAHERGEEGYVRERRGECEGDGRGGSRRIRPGCNYQRG